MLKHKLGLALSLIALLLSMIGGRLQSPIIILSVLLAAALSAAVTLTSDSEENYPWVLGILALTLLYQVTLFSPLLVGADIHFEYYYFEKASWFSQPPHAYNATILNYTVGPIVKLLGIDGRWVFKAVLPILLAGVPIVMYHTFSKFIPKRDALLSCLFFITVPTFFMEATGAVKTMSALIFLPLTFYLLQNQVKHRYWLIGACVILAVGIHYTQGIIVGFYLLLFTALVPLISRAFNMKYEVSIKKLLLVASVSGLLGVTFISTAAEGVAATNILTMFTGTPSIYLHGFPKVDPRTPDWGASIIEYEAPTLSGYTTWLGSERPSRSVPVPIGEEIERATEALIGKPSVRDVALGLDFMQVSIPSKAFRIVQTLTETFIVVGAFYLLRNRRKFKAEYLALVGASFLLLATAVLLPNYSAVINLTLWYLMTLIVLAPLLVIGFKAVFKRRYLYPLGAVLAVYSLFTTGIVYELTGNTNTSSISIPYSVPLSSYRLDLSTVLSRNDMDVVDYAHSNNIKPIIADLNGGFQLEENYGREGGWGFIGLAPRKIPGGYYIFLRERNTKTRSLTYFAQMGLRQTFTYEWLGFDYVLDRSTIVYQRGDAMIIRYQGDGK